MYRVLAVTNVAVTEEIDYPNVGYYYDLTSLGNILGERLIRIDINC